jgi:hypothetical protein
MTNVSLVDVKIRQKLEEQQKLIQKIELLENSLVIKSLEEKVGKLENELGLLQKARNKQENDKTNAQDAINCFWYYLEHLEELILQKDNPVQSAKLFSLIFMEKPSYEELIVGTPKIRRVFSLNDASKIDCEPGGIRTRDQELKRLLLYR